MSKWKSARAPPSARPPSSTNHKYASHQMQRSFTLENKSRTFKKLKETQNLSVLFDFFLTEPTSNPSTSHVSSLHSKLFRWPPFPAGSWRQGPVHKSWNKPWVSRPLSPLSNVGLSTWPQLTLAKLVSHLNSLQISSQDVITFGSDKFWVVESKEQIS